MDVFSRFRTRCLAALDGTPFDITYVMRNIDEMISQARAADATFPESDLDKAAYTAVFNCAAMSLMCHTYNLADAALSIEGEFVLSGLRVFSDTMVERGYISSSEMKEIMSNVVNTTFFRN